MINCHKCEDQISAYLENELHGERKAEIEQHIKSCLKCAKKTQQVNLVKNTLNKLTAISVLPDFDTLLRAQVMLEKRKERRSPQRKIFPELFRKPVYGISFAMVSLALLITIISITMFQTKEIPDAVKNPNSNGGSQYYVRNMQNGVLTIYPIERRTINEINKRGSSEFLRNRNRDQLETVSDLDSTRFTANEGIYKKLNSNIYQTSY